MSLALVRGIDRWPVNSPHKRPVTRNMLPFDDMIMRLSTLEMRSRWPFWMTSSSPPKVIQNHWEPNLKNDIYNIAVSIVSADGLAPLDARPSAGRVMSKFGSCTLVTSTWWVPEALALAMCQAISSSNEDNLQCPQCPQRFLPGNHCRQKMKLLEPWKQKAYQPLQHIDQFVQVKFE